MGQRLFMMISLCYLCWWPHTHTLNGDYGFSAQFANCLHATAARVDNVQELREGIINESPSSRSSSSATFLENVRMCSFKTANRRRRRPKGPVRIVPLRWARDDGMLRFLGDPGNVWTYLSKIYLFVKNQLAVNSTKKFYTSATKTGEISNHSKSPLSRWDQTTSISLTTEPQTISRDHPPRSCQSQTAWCVSCCEKICISGQMGQTTGVGSLKCTHAATLLPHTNRYSTHPEWHRT